MDIEYNSIGELYMKIMIGAMAGLFVIASLNNIVLSNIALSDDKFPLRKSFPTLKTIETAELTKIYDTAPIPRPQWCWRQYQGTP